MLNIISIMLEHANLDPKVQAIQRAIDSELETSFANLTDSLSDREAAELFLPALGTLEKLRQGGKPNYSAPMVPFIYAQRYQMCHVQFACKLIRITLLGLKKYSQSSPSGDPLHVIDFGAGLLATQVGLALALSSADDSNILRRKFVVHSVDESAAMIGFGLQLWHRIEEIARSDDELHSLSRACNQIEIDPIIVQPDESVIDLLPADIRGRCWIVCLHGFYGHSDSGFSITESISECCQRLPVEAGILSTHSNKWFHISKSAGSFGGFLKLKLGGDTAEQFEDFGLAHNSKHSQFYATGKSDMVRQIKAAGFVHDPGHWCPREAVALSFIQGLV